MKREIKFRAWDSEDKAMWWFDISEVWQFENSLYRFEIMQFTGLHDKNGKEIYEGDILENTVNLRGSIEFHDGKFIWRYRNKRNVEFLATLDYGLLKNKAIVGNIYENPELINEKS